MKMAKGQNKIVEALKAVLPEEAHFLVEPVRRWKENRPFRSPYRPHLLALLKSLGYKDLAVALGAYFSYPASERFREAAYREAQKVLRG